MQFEDLSLETNVFAFSIGTKAKARDVLLPAHLQDLPIGERVSPLVEAETHSPISYQVSKQLSTLLRHGHLLREEDGATEFWRVNDYDRNDFGRS